MKKILQRNFSCRPTGNDIGRIVVLPHNTVTIDGIIGYGGYSVIFSVTSKVSHKESGPSSKKKALKRTTTSNSFDYNSCLMEIEIMKKCQNTNIIKYFDSIVSNQDDFRKEVFILMELCQKNLISVLQKHRNSSKSDRKLLSKKVSSDVCKGLLALHSHSPPIINRDLKAENVLIDSKKNFVICDFGSAVFETEQKDMEFEELKSLEEEINKVTTLGYRAPEMADVYNGEHISHKADIWAFGCLVYFMCFYQMPFNDNVLSILSARYTFPATCEPVLQEIIECCLVVSPNDRPEVEDILKFMEGKVSRAELCKKSSVKDEIDRKPSSVVGVPDDVFVNSPFSFPKSPWPLDASMLKMDDFGRNNPFCIINDGFNDADDNGCVNIFFDDL